MGLMVAMRARWPQLEVHRGAGVLKLESEVGGIASVSHPQALLEPGVPTGIGPYRQTVLIFKGAQELEAARADRATGKLVRAELVAAIAVAHENFHLGHHQYPLHRRLQGRHQQPVISPRVRLRDGAAGKATQGVGDQPLTLEGVAGGGKISSGKSHGRIPGCSSSMRSPVADVRSEEHTSELQSQSNLVCRLLLEKKNARG